mgnify:CR=1 FL=1|jgi:SAM-dependent methyltransferase
METTAATEMHANKPAYVQPLPRVNAGGHAAVPMDLSPSTSACPRVTHAGIAGGRTLFYTPILLRHRVDRVRERFLQLHADAETTAFLRAYCTDKESVVRDGLAHALRWMGWSLTDVNGMLGRGQMFVCSNAHVRKLLAASGWGPKEFAQCAGRRAGRGSGASAAGAGGGADDGGEDEEGAVKISNSNGNDNDTTTAVSGVGGGALLDVGAGDGTVTSTALAPLVGFFRQGMGSSATTTNTTASANTPGLVVTTEVSGPMVTRLRSHGFVCHETVDLRTCAALLPAMRGAFDIVACLNVLDRADRPRRLLEDLAALVKPGTGRVVLAVVLPFCPFVESGSRQLQPSERLNMRGGMCREGAYFEWSVDAMVTQVLEPAGFHVHAWSQLPYLCSGDRAAPYYVLYDALFVLSKPE